MKFFIVDVFSEKKYQGNQLAVIIPNSELSIIEMQQIAREINFSETTFILSDKLSNGGYDVRIFTPHIEIPFAGHPTLGTAFVIQQFLEKNFDKKIILNLNIGQIPVFFKGANCDDIWMQQKEPTFGQIFQPKIFSEILQISEQDINANYPIQVVSTGLPAIIIPLHNLKAVQKCRINQKRFQDFIDKVFQANILAFTPDVINSKNNLHVRVFLDDPGFFEDSATGSANGNLAGYLLEHNFCQSSKINLRVEQGYSINRPSLIKIDASKVNGKFAIHIGGKVISVAEGKWFSRASDHPRVI